MGWLGAIAIVFSAVVLRVSLVQQRLESRSRARLVFAAAFALTASAVTLKFRHEMPALGGFEGGDRYFFLIRVFLVLLVVLSLDFTTIPGRVAALLFGLGIIASLPTFRAPPLVDFHWRDHARDIEAGQPSLIPVNPPGLDFPHPGRGHPGVSR